MNEERADQQQYPNKQSDLKVCLPKEPTTPYKVILYAIYIYI